MVENSTKFTLNTNYKLLLRNHIYYSTLNENKMFDFNFTITAASDSIHFTISSPNEEAVQQFAHDFLSLFPGMVDLENKKVESRVITQDIRDAVQVFVQPLNEKIPSLNRVSAFFRNLKDGELFFVAPFFIENQKEALLLHGRLDAIATGEDYREQEKEIMGLFGSLLDDYEIRTYGQTRIQIGEIDKSKRVCRFCGNSSVPLTFKSKAHAISEGLGNKTVVLLDECDSCNGEFSKNVEQDIIEYFSFLRTAVGIKGKGGDKKVDGHNFNLEKNSTLVLNFYSEDDIPKSLESDSSHLFNEILKQKKQIALQNIYKCLSKYFLSVIDAKYLEKFEKTIEWINGKLILKALPKVGKLDFWNAFQEQPTLTTYIRKNDNQKIPFAVGEFQFAFLRYIFIIPCCAENDFEYINQSEFDSFLDTFTHYKVASGLTFVDFSDDQKRNLKVRLKILKAVMPEEQSIEENPSAEK
jgi:hypothetical protein